MNVYDRLHNEIIILTWNDWRMGQTFACDNIFITLEVSVVHLIALFNFQYFQILLVPRKNWFRFCGYSIFPKNKKNLLIIFLMIKCTNYLAKVLISGYLPALPRSLLCDIPLIGSCGRFARAPLSDVFVGIFYRRFCIRRV